MSLIFGDYKFETNSTSFDTEHLKESNLPPYFDKFGYWNNETVYLGNYHSVYTPEAKYELPIYTLDNLTISANARLDNRAELFKLLDLSTALLNEIPNNVLILKAYQKWYTDCVNYIHGDWAFAIWNDEKKELFIARDQFGLTGIYYSQNENNLVFSSRLKGILNTTNNAEIDESTLLNIQFKTTNDGNKTLYKHIFQLERGHFLLVRNRELIYKQYFSFSLPTTLSYTNNQDYIDHFLELYENAVKVRMHSTGKLGSMLSGGLDSGSVTALVAKELKKTNQNLISFTSVPLYDSSRLTLSHHFGDETEYSKSTAEYSGNIEHFFVNGSEISLIQGIESYIENHCAPPGTPGNTYWIQEILSNANKMGIKTLFGGFAGNATISWNESLNNLTLFEKLQRKDIKLQTKIKYIKQFILNSSKKKNTNSINTQHENENKFSCFNKELFNNSIPLESINQSYNTRKLSNFDKRLMLIGPENTNVSSVWQEYGYRNDLNIVDPTRDLNLTNYCLSLPDHLFYNRYLIRESMRGILPENVRNNKLRGKQASDVQLFIKENYVNINKIITKFEEYSSICRLIDIDKLKDILIKINRSPSLQLQKDCDTILIKGISYGLFIEKQNKYDTRNKQD